MNSEIALPEMLPVHKKKAINSSCLLVLKSYMRKLLFLAHVLGSLVEIENNSAFLTSEARLSLRDVPMQSIS